jgi:hypothetical protein
MIDVPMVVAGGKLLDHSSSTSYTHYSDNINNKQQTRPNPSQTYNLKYMR